MKGRFEGISFLFPMEQLFEKYVAITLRKQLANGYQLSAQSALGHLAEHKGGKWFNLKPDLVIKQKQNIVSILDTKWKLLDQSLGTPREKYGLSQSDFYQMYAYGHQILKGEGTLFLIYPLHRGFRKTLDAFSISESLTLFVVPWDMETDRLLLPTEVEWLQ